MLADDKARDPMNSEPLRIEYSLPVDGNPPTARVATYDAYLRELTTLIASGFIEDRWRVAETQELSRFAAELAGKYYLKRRALPAISLVDNVANVTAVSNDLGYEQLFARQIEGLGRPGDVLLAFTTSGASANTTLAVKKAREMGVLTVGFTGRRGADFAALCDHCIVVPSEDTPRIQEVHLALAHNICALTEDALFRGR